jgi:hypothetical protein
MPGQRGIYVLGLFDLDNITVREEESSFELVTCYIVELGGGRTKDRAPTKD